MSGIETRETATATITATATLTPTMSASLTPDELPLLDTVAVEFESATYTYDGDGSMVKSVVNGLTTFYVGGYYEYVEVEDGDDTITTETKYYTGATGRFAMRVDTETTNGMISTTTNELYWIFSDHLQSSTVILDDDWWDLFEMGIVELVGYTAPKLIENGHGRIVPIVGIYFSLKNLDENVFFIE